MQSNINRAVQFMPFDALSGFKEALKEVERIVANKKELSEDYFEYLNDKIKQIKIGDNIKIKYYYNLEYIESFGIIKKIDYINKVIYLMNTKIPIDDIVDIDIIK